MEILIWPFTFSSSYDEMMLRSQTGKIENKIQIQIQIELCTTSTSYES